MHQENPPKTSYGVSSYGLIKEEPQKTKEFLDMALTLNNVNQRMLPPCMPESVNSGHLWRVRGIDICIWYLWLSVTNIRILGECFRLMGTFTLCISGLFDYSIPNTLVIGK